MPDVFFTATAAVAGRDADPWPDIVHEADVASLRDRWREARERGEAFVGRVRLRGADDRFAPYTLRGVPLRGAEGEILAWVVARVVDEDPPDAAEALTDLFRAVSDTAADAIFVKDLDGRYVYVNPSCEALFGAPAPVVVGSFDDRWFGAEGAAILRADDRRVLDARRPINRDEDLEVGGRRFTFSTTKAPYVDRAGRVRGIIGIARDVTAHRREQRELRASVQRLEAIAVASPGALCSFHQATDGTFSFTYQSPSLAELFGIPADELARDASLLFDVIHPDDRAAVQLEIERSAATMTSWRRDYRVLHPRRGEIWIEGASTPVREVDGSITWHGVLIDATERKRGDVLVRAERDRFAAITATVPGAVYSFLQRGDGTVDFPFLSPSIVDFCGHPSEVLYAQPELALAAVHPEDLGQVLASALIAHETFEPWREEFRMVHPVKGEIWVEGRSQPIREPDGRVVFHGIFVDISERKRGEMALRASEARYRTLVDVLPDAVFMNRGGVITFCNAAFVRLMGASSSSELIGKTPFEIFHPDDHAAIRARIAAMMGQGGSAPPLEESVVTLDGTRRFVSVIATSLVDHDAPAILVVLHDLTVRQRTEHMLGSVLESVDDAILTIDARGEIRSCNPATSRIFGWDLDELVGANVRALMPAAQAAHHDDHLAAYVAGGGERPIRRAREFVGRRKDGSTFPLELSVTSLVLDGARHFTGVIRDITERTELEAQFRQAHKMEAFGQLAGGVAHDFNNLLTVILGEAANVGVALAPKHPATSSLDEIERAAQRAAALTRQLLAFSRKSVLEPKLIDVNGVVRDSETLLRRLIGEDIRVSSRLEATLRPVFVDPGQLGQVIMNLAVNARDAMPRGGELDLATLNVELDERRARTLGLAPGAFVRLSVRDTGTGMTPEVRSRVFQPFFTTKEVGRGTGLGLAVVHGIVAQSGGAIDVETEVGRGTCWEIFLPAAESVPVTRAALSTSPPDAGPATVVVVEDDDAVRRLAKRVLEGKGYRVLAARHGAEALELLESAHADVDLVITDVVMPVLDGRELAEQIRERFPALKILFVSGYTDDVLLRRGLQSEQVDFVQKPYSVASLAAAVARVLTRR